MCFLNRCTFLVAILAADVFAPSLQAAVTVYVDLINSGAAGSGSLGKIVGTGGSVTNVNVGSGFDFPNGLVQDSSGNFYVANENGTTVSKITAGGTVSTFCTLQAGGTPAPYDLAFDTSGNLYVAVAGQNNIQKYSSMGMYLSTITNPNLGTPDGLLFDSSGNFYVSNYGVDKILKFNSSGTLLSTINANGQTDGMVFDTSGNILVAEPSLGTIEKYSTAGVDLGTFASGLLTPTDLAYDSSGNLYVVENNGNLGNGTIEEFSPTGTDLGAFKTGLNNPTSLFIATPEPSKILLLLMGGMALMLRRRR